MRWFRLYSETIDDEKLRLLAFEDRWHFIAILCLKSSGILDLPSTKEMMRRKVCIKLGVQHTELDEIARRLSEVNLIDFKTLQPIAWNRRQYLSDNSSERVRKYRKNKETGNVSETTLKRHSDTESDTDTETDKKDIMSGRPDVAPRKGNTHRKDAEEILAFLNTKTGKNFKPVDANINLISARLKDGATLDECRAVIARKFRDWSNDDKMAPYLRPSTLFNREKFAQYQGELGQEVKRYAVS